MFQMRRYSAAFLGACALVLGACGGNTPTTPTEQDTGTISDNPLMISLDPIGMTFSSLTATPPAPQTLAVSGLVAIGSAVEFGQVSYGGGAIGWLHANPTPTFQRDPLAWLHTISIDPGVYASLPNGAYYATVPVIVRAAQNSPQTFSVLLCKGTTSCLPLNGVTNGSLDGGDPSWDRHGAINSSGGYYYDDYFITVPASTTVYLTMHGSCSGYGLSDPYLYIYDMSDSFIGSNDDGFGCLNSYFAIVNGGGTAKTYRVRATSFGTSGFGSYQLRTSTSAAFLRSDEPTTVSPEIAEMIARKAASPEK